MVAPFVQASFQPLREQQGVGPLPKSAVAPNGMFFDHLHVYTFSLMALSVHRIECLAHNHKHLGGLDIILAHRVQKSPSIQQGGRILSTSCCLLRSVQKLHELFDFQHRGEVRARSRNRLAAHPPVNALNDSLHGPVRVCVLIQIVSMNRACTLFNGSPSRDLPTLHLTQTCSPRGAHAKIAGHLMSRQFLPQTFCIVRGSIFAFLACAPRPHKAHELFFELSRPTELILLKIICDPLQRLSTLSHDDFKFGFTTLHSRSELFS